MFRTRLIALLIGSVLKITASFSLFLCSVLVEEVGDGVWFFSPQARRHRDFTAFLKTNRVLLADGATDSTAVALPLIDNSLLI